MRQILVRVARCCVAACLFVSSLLVSSMPAGQQPPVIRIDTHLVQVDVVVRNGKGPVRGLTKDDFTLFEKGKQQRISLFKVTEAHQATQDAPPLPPGVVSNRIQQSGDAPGNVIVILLDRLNTPPDVQPFGDRELLHFLQTAHKGDLIGIYTLGEQLGVVQDFTTDLDRLIRVASHINFFQPIDLKDNALTEEVAEAAKGTKAASVASAMGGGTSIDALKEMAELADTDTIARTTRALSAIAKHLAGVPGRKNLVWISSGFPMLSMSKHSVVNNAPEVQKATRALNEANVAVFPVDARGLTAAGFTVPNLDTMNVVASATGGEAFYANNDIEGSIRKAVNDGEVTYTLGFYPENGTLDGTYHSLRVKVAKSGVDVRYRKGYLASVTKTPTQTQLRAALPEMFASPFDATAIGITANAEADPAAPGNYKLTANIDISDLHMERAEDGSWTGSIAAVFRSELDTSPDFRFTVFSIKLNEEEYKVALKNGLSVTGVINIGALSGRVRALVQDQNTGAAGSVWIPTSSKGGVEK